MNPIARRITGVGYSARREVIYPLADVRSARNHYLLKVANVMDRTLRARGTQAQKRMLKYIGQNKPGQALWSPNRPYCQIMGPIWQAHHRDEQWDMYWNQTGRKTDLSQRDISWWVPQTASLEEEQNRAMPKATNNSIFHAQAEEIRSQGENEQRVFQYTGLTDWRSVASKVLDNIGWTAECAYENTIFPQKVGTNAVAWEKIKWEQENPSPPMKTPQRWWCTS